MAGESGGCVAGVGGSKERLEGVGGREEGGEVSVGGRPDPDLVRELGLLGTQRRKGEPGGDQEVE